MDVKEFKEKYPHLSHLEGNDLWDAMALAVWKEQKPFEKKEGDDEIAKTIEMPDGYSFSITKGAVRSMEEMMKEAKPAEFDETKFGLFVPSQNKAKN